MAETLIALGIVLLIIAIPILLVRWIFRINTQIWLLTEIREELKTLNSKNSPQKKGLGEIKKME